MRYNITKLDVKYAFLYSGKSERDVYFVPPRDLSDREKLLWLFLAASYGLANTNTKCQG